jgi:hypothetical protein
VDAAVENFGARLTTVVARVYPDLLRPRGSRREEPLDDQVAEPATAWLLSCHISDVWSVTTMTDRDGEGD